MPHVIPYQPYVLGCAIGLIIWILFVCILHICLWKRLICVKNQELRERKADDILVLGKSYDSSYEIPVTMLRMCGYSFLLLPGDTKITLQIIICQCNIMMFSENLKIDTTFDKGTTQHAVLDEGFGYQSFPVNDQTESTQGKTSCKTFSCSCVICLDDFQIAENILLLKCQHGFHKQCIVQSLFGKPNCPICNNTNGIQEMRWQDETSLLVPDLGSSYGSMGRTER